MAEDDIHPNSFFPPTTKPSEILPVVLPVNISRVGYNALAIYTGFLTFFGIFNNSIVIYLFIRFPSLRQPINYFLLNICLCDFLVSILASPMTFTSNIAGHWLYGDVGCQIYAFFVTAGGTEQIVALATASVHRCFLVTRPFFAKRMTSAWAWFFIALSWLYSILVSLPPVFGWNSYVPEGAGTACAVDWTDWSFNGSSYIIFIFFFVLVVPLAVICTSYSALLLTVKRVSHTEASQSSTRQLERRVTMLVLLMIFCFMFAWTPYSVFALYVVFSKQHTVSPLAATFPPFFAKSCTVYNPLLYFLLNKQFRTALFSLMGHEETTDETTVNHRLNGATDRLRTFANTTKANTITSNIMLESTPELKRTISQPAMTRKARFTNDLDGTHFTLPGEVV